MPEYREASHEIHKIFFCCKVWQQCFNKLLIVATINTVLQSVLNSCKASQYVTEGFKLLQDVATRF